jgi:hypothetical protein
MRGFSRLSLLIVWLIGVKASGNADATWQRPILVVISLYWRQRRQAAAASTPATEPTGSDHMAQAKHAGIASNRAAPPSAPPHRSCPAYRL